MATRVQSNIKQAVFAGSWTIRFSTGATVAGNTLVLLISTFGSSGAISAVSDPVNGAWTQVGGAATSGSAVVQVFIKENASSITTAQDITCTSTAGDKGAVVVEYSGQLTASSLDPSSYTSTTGNGTSSASTSVTTGSITTTTASDTYICVASGDGATTTWTAPSSPWSFVQQNGNNAFMAIATEDRINSDAAGTFSQTVVNSVSENKAAKILALISVPDGPQPISARSATWDFPHPPMRTA